MPTSQFCNVSCEVDKIVCTSPSSSSVNKLLLFYPQVTVSIIDVNPFCIVSVFLMHVFNELKYLKSVLMINRLFNLLKSAALLSSDVYCLIVCTPGCKLLCCVVGWPVIVICCCLTDVQYVTRAVRVVDLITNLDMQAFQQYGGMTAFINRLQVSAWHELCT